MGFMDADAAKAFVAAQDEKIAALTKEIKALGMKASVKEARAEKNTELKALKKDPQYEDAKALVDGKDPPHGNPAGGYAGMAVAGPETVADKEAKEGGDAKEKKEKPKKSMESAGLSPDERKELEGLKDKLINRKKELKEQGMSGGQMNKEPQIVEWVKRMNELKEKENPGSSMSEKDKKKDSKKKKGGSLSAEELKELDKLKVEVEEYKHKLKTDCGYTKKDMDKDPDLQEMLAKIKDFEGRSG